MKQKIQILKSHLSGPLRMKKTCSEEFFNCDESTEHQKLEDTDLVKSFENLSIDQARAPWTLTLTVRGKNKLYSQGILNII